MSWQMLPAQGLVLSWFTGSLQSFCRDALNRTMSMEGRQGDKNGEEKEGTNNEKELEKKNLDI